MIRLPISNARTLLCLFGCVWGLGLGCGEEEKSSSPGQDSDGGKPRTVRTPDGEDSGEPEQDASEPEQDASEPEEDAGEPTKSNKARIKGRVTFADGSAVGQIDVEIGGKRYKSDSRGVFAAEDLPEGELEVSVEGASVSRAQAKVEASEERVAQVELFVMPMKKAAIAAAENAGEVAVDADVVKVKLAAGSLRVKSSGEPASGAAEARYAVSKQSRDIKAAPGRLKGIRDDQDVDLESFGIIDMRLFQGDEELELTQEAELELPLGPNSFAEGQEVDAWSFDRESGKWKAENRAVVDKTKGANGVAKIKAGHFSWWSVAQPVEASTCVSGRLQAADEQPPSYLWVQAVNDSAWGVSWAQTDADGRFCLSAKPSSTYSFGAFGVDASTYFEWTQSIITPSGAAMCGGAGCTDLGTIAGVSLFDECTGDVTSDQNHVLVLSSTNTALDDALKTMLEGYGHSVTIGPNYGVFDGSTDLDSFDAIYLQANAYWSADMPEPGQRQLINWVNCGGGLVTVEWTTWIIGTDATRLRFIDAIFPAARTANYTSTATETYTKVTDDSTLNAGLPDSFTFTTTNYSGTESYLNPRAGAVIYYDSAMLDAGVLGWDYNMGRVLTFSTTVGTNEIADPNFSRLISNAVDWVQRD